MEVPSHVVNVQGNAHAVCPSHVIRKACLSDAFPSPVVESIRRDTFDGIQNRFDGIHSKGKKCRRHWLPTIHASDRTTERPSELLAEGTFGREISKEKDIYVSMDASCIVVQDNPRIGISAPRRPLSRRAKICSISTLNICVTQRCSQNLMRG